MAKPGETRITAKQKRAQENEDLGAVLKLIRHVRNLHELGQHSIRAEAVQAEEALERAMGKRMSEIYLTKTWRNA